VDIEVKAYMQNVVTFLKMHRAVAGGTTPQATRHFDLLVRCLAPLHGLDFATPSLVALAAMKVYRHRLHIIEDPRDERSAQYGSELSAISAMLETYRPETIIEEVLSNIEVPL
jgi:MoxR-like ATPase